jgi:hypothetical protein
MHVGFFVIYSSGQWGREMNVPQSPCRIIVGEEEDEAV